MPRPNAKQGSVFFTSNFISPVKIGGGCDGRGGRKEGRKEAGDDGGGDDEKAVRVHSFGGVL